MILTFLSYIIFFIDFVITWCLKGKEFDNKLLTVLMTAMSLCILVGIQSHRKGI